MKNKNKIDIVKIFDSFQKTIQNKPSYEKMIEEVRMMKFKVRPMQGDVMLFNLKDERFIEILWSLGKLDKLFQDEYKKLPRKDREAFFRIFDLIYQKLQLELNNINLKKDKTAGISSIVEMEIFKEQTQKKLN